MNDADFWHSSALGQSLEKWRESSGLKIHIYSCNSVGLPTLYNRHIQSTPRSDILVFIHDDVWLDDPDFLGQIRKALGRYDVAGVAGNIRLQPNQPAWLFKEIVDGKFVWDTGFLSGSIGDGTSSKKKLDRYGPAPMDCKVLDGVILAARCANLRRSGVSFDERYKFHFYDMDFCRAAGNAGLSIGTWPIALTHGSGGVFGSPGWLEAYQVYLQKWNSGR
jgi:GT2 family glycosyltransferase